MKLNVNLYQDEFRPKRILLGLRTQALLAALALVGALGYAGYLQQVQGKLEDRLADREAQVAQVQDLVADLEQRLEKARHTGPLEAEIAQARARLEAMDHLIERVAPSAGEARILPSDYLAGLAEQRSDGLWLTRIQVAGRGSDLQLEGGTLKPEHIPALIGRLSRSPAFRDRRFRALDIQRPEEEGADPGLRFQLTTRRGDSDD